VTPLNDGAQPPRETPDLVGAYPHLNDEQLDRLRSFGTERPTSSEQVLVATGERTDSLLFILDGVVMTAEDPEPDSAALAAHAAGSDPRVGVHGRGRFVGDVGAFEGQPSFLTVIVLESGRVLEVPFRELERVARVNPVLGDIILRSCLVRRSLLIGIGAGMRIVGSCHLPRTRQLLDFVARNRLPYRLIDLDRDPHAEEVVRRLGIPRRDVPIVLLGRDRVLRRATPEKLAAALGIRAARRTARTDLVVIGGGPGGLSATLSAAADGLSVVLCDAVAVGGQSATTSLVENYLGFPTGISGAELAERAHLQVRKFGAQVTVPSRARHVEQQAGELLVRVTGGGRLRARAVVVATGAWYRRLNVSGIDRVEPSSVFYAATMHEARICGTQPVVVVGGGNSAGQAALFLAESGSRVCLVVRDGSLDNDMSRYLIDRIADHPGIEVMLGTEVSEVLGESELDGVRVQPADGADRELPARYLFVFIGTQAQSNWLPAEVGRDERGYVVTGSAPTGSPVWRDAGRQPLPLETTIPGLFAIGDVRSGSVKRMSAAIGEGASVVRMVHDHLGPVRS
jgi:thioredoxin reductase (NADPH)